MSLRSSHPPRQVSLKVLLKVTSKFTIRFRPATSRTSQPRHSNAPRMPSMLLICLCSGRLLFPFRRAVLTWFFASPSAPAQRASLSIRKARWNAARSQHFFQLTRFRPSVTSCSATMKHTHNTRPRNLGEVEQLVMDYVWSHGPVSSEACREALAARRPMKESTIRTVLRRLEVKGYVAHEVSGRTYIYRAAEPRQNVAVRAVKHIIDRFCGGSAEQLVIGMVDNAVLDRRQLERLTQKIAERKIAQRKEGKS